MFAKEEDMADELPVPPWRKQRRMPVKQQLSLDAILDAATRILDADGLGAVSMRRVAEELNTGAASLYAYVSNKDELLELVYERILDEIEVPAPDPRRWEQQLRDLCWAAYRVLSAHNDIARVSLANLPLGANALRLGEAMLAIMLAGGVPVQHAAWAVDRIGLYISADAYEGSLYGVRQKSSGKDMDTFLKDYFGQIRSYYESLPAQAFPNLTSNLDAMMSGDGDERFGFGLELMLKSLVASAKAGKIDRP
jgi:AcrR family transcriptional regulator